MNKIYHNPRCGTSRTTLQIFHDRGIDVEIIEYLKTPLTRAQLQKLISDAGLTVRQAVREKEDIYQELGLGDPTVDDASLLDAIVQHPVLMNRPFVVTSKGTRLCRPATVVEEIL
jgi:arsenate reductase